MTQGFPPRLPPWEHLDQVGLDDQPRLAIIDPTVCVSPTRSGSLGRLRAASRSFDAASLAPTDVGGVAPESCIAEPLFWVRKRTSGFDPRATSGGRPATLLPGFARAIETATREWAERLWRRWGRRCRKTSKYFVSAKGDRTWSIASRGLDRATVATLLANPDAPFASEGTILLKKSRTTTVAETTMLVDGRPTRVIYKRFNKKKWIDPLLTYFRPSRAWQAWQAAQHLTSRAIPTPRNLAFISRMRQFPRDLFWYLPHETYLVTIKAESAVTLTEYATQTLAKLQPAARRVQIRRLTLALAKLMRQLHDRSLSHRDLKGSNILVLGDPSSSEIELNLIDLVGVRLIHPLPRHRRAQNLARLYLSLATIPGRTRTDSLRFLRAYFPWGLSPRNDWKELWRAVAAYGETKRSRNQRRGRVLT